MKGLKYVLLYQRNKKRQKHVTKRVLTGITVGGVPESPKKYDKYVHNMI